MSLTATPRAEGGSAVHAVWDQSSKNLRGLVAVTAMRFIGPRSLSSYYKKVYDNYTRAYPKSLTTSATRRTWSMSELVGMR